MPRLLLVDDDPGLLAARSAVLQGSGFDVVGVPSAEDALALLGDPAINQEWQLIITDHVMPGQSGLDFVRNLRQLCPSVPVMVVSGFAVPEREYEDLGVEFLPKPCLPDELIQRIRSLVSKNYRPSL